ncbi:MAG: cobalamin-dependent protein [Thermodesulfobacteriota bacterium]|jgi:corrinoid protein of di/trimethylamine methyltransferase
MEYSKLTDKEKALLDSLRDAIVVIDTEAAKEAAQKIIDAQIDPRVALKHSIAEAAELVGAKFDCGELFLPHLVMVGDLMEEVGTILEKDIPPDQIQKKKVIVIATVQGDMHSIGKNIVSTMLRSSGFIIHDMGVDVPSTAIIQKAKEVKAEMIALSSLLTTTMPYQKEVIDDLVSMRLRDQFKVMVGGGPVTRQYAESIGADGYGKDAIEALEEAKRLLL